METSSNEIRCPDRFPRSGVSLIEALIVVAVLFMLIQLALPAIQSARESARRNACQGNVQQIVLAIAKYEQAQQSLPVGGLACCYGTWMPKVFPYLDELDVDRLYGFSAERSPQVRYHSARNAPITTKHYPLFLCPSDKPSRATAFSDVTKHNYAVNYGNTGYVESDVPGRLNDDVPIATDYREVKYAGAPFLVDWSNGFSYPPVRRADITDGIGKTLFVAEVVQGQAGDDLRGLIWYSPLAGFMTFLVPNSPDPDVLKKENYCGAQWPNKPPCTGLDSNQRLMTQAARSRHPGGVNAAMGDGATRFVSDTIDIAAWRAMSTTQGKEKVDY